MEVTKTAMEDALLSQQDRLPIAELAKDGTYLLVTAGDNRVTIYKGTTSSRRQIATDAVMFGERFNKRNYIQQVDVEIEEAKTILKGLLKLISVLDVLADTD